MKRHAIRLSLLALTWFALATSAGAATNNLTHTYPSGAQIAIAIGNDLYTTLDPRFKRGLNPSTIALEQLETPVIAPIQGTRQGFSCQVSVSKGFIDLLNHIAHAKAIDKIQPGYFRQYVSDLAHAGANENPPAPRNLNDPRFWTDAVMMDQGSLFNQMISMTLAMNLSHHYLDHYAKYASRMPQGKTEPINDFIDASEWEDSVRFATMNSLDCALATQGAKALFECIDQMPRRPEWAAYIVPPSVNIKKLNHELWRYEQEFFHGGAAQRDRLAWGG